MSLGMALQIGRSALTASQLGLQVAGNNIANVATQGYSRQVATFSPIGGGDPMSRLNIGRGVAVSDVRRQIDSALQSRLWLSTSDQSAADQTHQILSSIETTIGELSGNAMSKELSSFYNAWSEAANGTLSASQVIQQGDKLASYIRGLRADLGKVSSQIDSDLGANVAHADGLLGRIADLNGAIAAAEVSGATASSLRDQRDQVVTELSTIMDVTTIEHQGGSIDVLVGSTPVVLGGLSRGLKLARRATDDGPVLAVTVAADNQELPIRGGRLGALLDARDNGVSPTIDQLDAIAGQLIFQVNKLHSTGENASNLKNITGTLSIQTADRTLALNDPANTTMSGLPYRATNGGFMVRVKDTATGTISTVRIDVDLDGITNAGTPGTADDTSADGIRSQLDAVAGISATFDSSGKLVVTADQGFEFSFGDDSSGALAVLGVNTYFKGTTGADIAVRDELKNDPSGLMTGRIINGTLVQNGTALALVKSQDTAIGALSNRSVSQTWVDTVQAVGVRTSAAESNSKAAAVVTESLESQRAGVSGVSIDEESINLMNYQRQYQGAARLISIADELMQTLISLV